MVDIFIPKHPQFNPSKIIEPKEPRPWSPEWTAIIGPIKEIGKGILTPEVWKQKDLITQFSVFIYPNDLTISINLVTGEIFFNTQLQYKPEPSEVPFRLIWFRQMEKPMFTLDHNSESFDLLYYGIGWQRTIKDKNEKFGYSILPDGHLIQNIK